MTYSLIQSFSVSCPYSKVFLVGFFNLKTQESYRILKIKMESLFSSENVASPCLKVDFFIMYLS